MRVNARSTKRQVDASEINLLWERPVLCDFFLQVSLNPIRGSTHSSYVLRAIGRAIELIELLTAVPTGEPLIGFHYCPRI